MKRSPALWFAAVLPLGLLGQDLTVAPVARRVQVIEEAQTRLKTVVSPLPGDFRHAFSMRGFEASVQKVEETKSSEPATGADLLAVLAGKIDAKARFEIRPGEPQLLAGKQRLGVGGRIPITHDGLIYELEITAIDRDRFTVRYKGEEYTRPITLKSPGK